MKGDIRIKVLKDTPFDRAGIDLSLSEFRSKYDWICTKSTSDEALIHYIQEWEKFPVTHNTINVGEWFKMVDYNGEDMPLYFIHEGILYSKEMDGMFHKFIVGNELKPENSIGCCSIYDARCLLSSAKYKKYVTYATNSVNKKL